MWTLDLAQHHHGRTVCVPNSPQGVLGPTLDPARGRHHHDREVHAIQRKLADPSDMIRAGRVDEVQLVLTPGHPAERRHETEVSGLLERLLIEERRALFDPALTTQRTTRVQQHLRQGRLSRRAMSGETESANVGVRLRPSRHAASPPF